MKDKILNILTVFILTFMTIFLILIGIVYLYFCGVNALSWSYDIASNLGLMIIRAILVAVLMIPSLFYTVFEYWDGIVHYGKYCAYIALTISIIFSIFGIQVENKKI